MDVVSASILVVGKDVDGVEDVVEVEVAVLVMDVLKVMLDDVVGDDEQAINDATI